MSKQELKNEDGELLSVTEGLRVVAQHMIRLCDDLWIQYTRDLQELKAQRMRTMRDEAQKALAIASEPLDWSKCPCCGTDASGAISYEEVEIEEGDALQKAHCRKCGATWGEWYRADERVVYDHGNK